MKKNRKRQKGFTLIELIVVIAILAILALIAIPRLTNFTSTAQDRADLANAKILTNIAHTIYADSTPNEFPSWPEEFSTLAATDSSGYLGEDITIQNDANEFKYDETQEQRQRKNITNPY